MEVSDTRVLLGHRAVKRDYNIGRTKLFDLIKRVRLRVLRTAVNA